MESLDLQTWTRIETMNQPIELPKDLSKPKLEAVIVGFPQCLGQFME